MLQKNYNDFFYNNTAVVIKPKSVGSKIFLKTLVGIGSVPYIWLVISGISESLISAIRFDEQYLSYCNGPGISVSERLDFSEVKRDTVCCISYAINNEYVNLYRRHVNTILHIWPL